MNGILFQVCDKYKRNILICLTQNLCCLQAIVTGHFDIHKNSIKARSILLQKSYSFLVAYAIHGNSLFFTICFHQLTNLVPDIFFVINDRKTHNATSFHNTITFSPHSVNLLLLIVERKSTLRLSLKVTPHK